MVYYKNNSGGIHGKNSDISYGDCRRRQCCPMRNPIRADQYTFSLTPAQTKEVIMGDGETWQEDNAIFLSGMYVLHGSGIRAADSRTLAFRSF